MTNKNRRPFSRCAKCNRLVCSPCVLERKTPNIVMYAHQYQILSKPYFRRLAIATASLGLSRREIPNWMADVIFSYEGLMLDPFSRPVEVRDTAIDDAFNDDGSFRWLSDFMRFAHAPIKQRPQLRVLERLVLLDLAFKIEKPEIAKHFGR